MRITLEDIAGMASPGWGEGSDVDVLDFEDKDREVLDEPGKYGEIAFNLRAKTNISPSPSLRPRRRKNPSSTPTTAAAKV